MGKKLNRNHAQTSRTPTDTATSWAKVKNYFLFLGGGFTSCGWARKRLTAERANSSLPGFLPEPPIGSAFLGRSVQGGSGGDLLREINVGGEEVAPLFPSRKPSGGRAGQVPPAPPCPSPPQGRRSPTPPWGRTRGGEGQGGGGVQENKRPTVQCTHESAPGTHNFCRILWPAGRVSGISGGWSRGSALVSTRIPPAGKRAHHPTMRLGWSGGRPNGEKSDMGPMPSAQTPKHRGPPGRWYRGRTSPATPRATRRKNAAHCAATRGELGACGAVPTSVVESTIAACRPDCHTALLLHESAGLAGHGCRGRPVRARLRKIEVGLSGPGL